MTNYREILRLSSLGLNNTQIAQSCACSRTTVIQTLRLAQAKGLSFPLPDEMSDKQLAEILFPSAPEPRGYKMPDYEYIHREMQKSGVTLNLLWMEYEDELFEDYVERMIATKFSQQSTIGMSFYLKKDTKHIMADISWGDYIKSSEKYTNEKGEEKISLVATVPPAFSLKTKRIQNVVEDLIKNAKKSILLTGYSVSEFVSEMIDTLVEKSQKGVLIRIFFNDIKSQVSIEKILRYRSKFLQVYNYTNKEDKMAALHAKILMVDDVDILISSANLSYHGMAGNIEIGTQVCSEKIAKQINELFKQLLFSKVFTAVNE